MYGIIAVLIIILLYEGDFVNLIPSRIRDRVMDWWEIHNIGFRMYLAIGILLLVLMPLGIHYGILNWGALIALAIYLFPMIAGFAIFIWYRLKYTGQQIKLVALKEISAKYIALKCLTGLGCRTTTLANGSVAVFYQRESFFMEFQGYYARVWTLSWACIKADNPDMPKIREAVNAANYAFGPTVLMSAPNYEGLIKLHARYDIMLFNPDNQQYLQSVLDSFLETKKEILKYLQEIGVAQTDSDNSPADSMSLRRI